MKTRPTAITVIESRRTRRVPKRSPSSPRKNIAKVMPPVKSETTIPARMSPSPRFSER